MPLESLPCEFLFTLTARTGDKPPVSVKGGPRGDRLIVTVTEGSFTGPKLSGTVADAAGGDWVIIRPDGTLVLDVRIALVTTDGATIYMIYGGFGKRGPEGTSIRTAPTFECGDERYAWLNTVQAVAYGSSAKGTVTYDVYALS
jgi:Protein of unknown function (DUF3237)